MIVGGKIRKAGLLLTCDSSGELNSQTHILYCLISNAMIVTQNKKPSIARLMCLPIKPCGPHERIGVFCKINTQKICVYILYSKRTQQQNAL